MVVRHSPRVGRRQFLLLAAATLVGCTAPVGNRTALGQSGRLSASVGGGTRNGSALVALEGGSDSTPSGPIVADADLRRVAMDNNQFAFDFFTALRTTTPHDNFVVSPLSIYTAFAMLYAGANGDTAAQLAHTLHYGEGAAPDQFHAVVGALLSAFTTRGSTEGVALSIANGLWGQQGYAYKPRFVELLNTRYNAPLQTADFTHDATGALQSINHWIDTATHGKITRLLTALDPATTLVLLNAIYFKGKWAAPFNPNETYKAAFTALDGSVHHVPTMHLTSRFAYAEGQGCQLVALPYADSTIRLIVLLPEAQQFVAIEQDLSSDGFAALTNALDRNETARVELSLPMFEDTTTRDLKSLLATLGLTLPFGEHADFSGISRQDRLVVDQALHQATITVDEQGTEAAATTAVTVTTLSAVVPQPAIEMNVNRAFLYFLQDRATGAILFAGRRVQP